MWFLSKCNIVSYTCVICDISSSSFPSLVYFLLISYTFSPPYASHIFITFSRLFLLFTSLSFSLYFAHQHIPSVRIWPLQALALSTLYHSLGHTFHHSWQEYNNNSNICNMSIVYILENSGSEVQQTKPFGVIIHGDRQELLLKYGTAENEWWK